MAKEIKKTQIVGRKACLIKLIEAAEKMGCPDLVENERVELQAIFDREGSEFNRMLIRTARMLLRS